MEGTRMDMDGGCPWVEYQLQYTNWCNTNNNEVRYFDVEITGDNALGVDHFVLYDTTEGSVEIQRWGEGGGGWCLSNDGKEGCWDSVSGAYYPVLGVSLDINGSSERIKFGRGEECNRDVVCSSGNCKYLAAGCVAKNCCTVSIPSWSSFEYHSCTFLLANLLLLPHCHSSLQLTVMKKW